MKNFTDQWKTLANAKKITAADVFQRCLLKAVRAKNWITLEEKQQLAVLILDSAFTEISNENKLANGCTPWQAVRSAARDSKYIENAHGLLEALETQEEVDLYKLIRDAVMAPLEERTKRNYVFVCVRTDIPVIHQLVQASHAALRAGAAFVKAGITDEIIADLYFAVVGVDDEEHLKGTEEYLYSHGYDTVRFTEPDIDNEVTAIVSFPIANNKKKLMSRYQKLEII